MQHRKTLMLVLTALFAALTAVGAFFKIPFALAAISLQFLFTAMAGILLGAGYGALSQLVYVLIGLVGVPIFALGGGFSYVLQPTFGFLLGLIPSAFVIGKLAKRPLTFWRTALAMLAGCPLRRRRAVSGADRQRVSRQGTDVLAGAQKRHAHLPAGRSAEDRLRQLPLRGDRAPSAAAFRRAAGGIRAAVPPL